MKNIIMRIARLFIGLFLYAVGIVMTINANLGLAPWDVFHQGIAINIGITIGKVSIIVGLILVIVNSIMGEKLGWGTLCNMLFIGLFIDFLMLNKIIPACHNFLSGIIMMGLGMFIIGISSYLYLSAELGSGPRDGLMVVLTKKTNKSVRLVRNTIETAVLIIGYFLSGFVGLGTFIIALSIGFFIQFAFTLFNFDVNNIEHRFINEDIKLFKNKSFIFSRGDINE